MDRGKRPASEGPHLCRPKSHPSWERWVVPGNLIISCSSIVLVTGSLRTVVGSSVEGEIISLLSSPMASPNEESRTTLTMGARTVREVVAQLVV
jgi:hypothetical protein